VTTALEVIFIMKCAVSTCYLLTCYGLVADLLATRRTILTCQDVANKSTTSRQQVVVMEFGS